jgi:hypothetical protein
MNEADKIVLDALKPHMSDLGYAMVVEKVEKAGGIKNLTDTVAIAELEVAKKKFGSRSAAGQYAANIRWGKGGAGLTATRDRAQEPRSGGRSVFDVNVDGKSRPVDFDITHTPISKVKMGSLVLGPNNEVHIVAGERIGAGGKMRTLLSQAAHFLSGKGGFKKAPFSPHSSTEVKPKADGTVPVLSIKFVAKEVGDALDMVKSAMEPEHFGYVAYAVQTAGGIKELRDLDAIALLKAALVEKNKSFSGDRSAAGRYAAQVRWGKAGKDLPSSSTSSNVSGGGDTMSTKYNPSARLKEADEIRASSGLANETKSELYTIAKALDKVNYHSGIIQKAKQRIAEGHPMADSFQNEVDRYTAHRNEQLTIAGRAVKKLAWMATRRDKGVELSQPEHKAFAQSRAAAVRKIHGIAKALYEDFKKGDLHNPQS